MLVNTLYGTFRGGGFVLALSLSLTATAAVVDAAEAAAEIAIPTQRWVTLTPGGEDPTFNVQFKITKKFKKATLVCAVPFSTPPGSPTSAISKVQPALTRSGMLSSIRMVYGKDGLAANTTSYSHPSGQELIYTVMATELTATQGSTVGQCVAPSVPLSGVGIVMVYLAKADDYNNPMSNVVALPAAAGDASIAEIGKSLGPMVVSAAPAPSP
ncbi:MAG: hypothetical protein MUF51_03640 [Vicinamibacteria bacterium]|jgi:hypothetical protein|nr:hypothetical protein [Vicinamibacteria bacterium]